ncbi:MAG: glycoside hydrolase family 3 C-terminal domain-containing protein [Lentimicrobium sp.]|nr:glycoside hydrolase family 3 C-terminal domain-containing protein [Lentimicrobium sp.]
MKQRIILILIIISTLLLCSCQSKQKPVNLNYEIDMKIKELLDQMTLEEKAGQMTQVTIDALTIGKNPKESDEPPMLDTNILKIAFERYHIGSVLNTANNRARERKEWNRLIGEIQEFAIQNSRLRIPVLYGLDMIHGASYVAGATLFPQQIGMAATWNPVLIERAGEITAYESRAVGCPWTFSPVLDLGIDPRWPRHWETFGEDPLLVSEMGKALIQGLQGRDNLLSDKNRIAVCLKHYLGYSQPVSGKDRTPALIPMNVLREYHLPAFKKAIETGAMSVMVNSGEINGMPVHASRFLLNDLLKGELGFSGLVVSDWGDIEYLQTRHKIAANQKEAVRIAVNAGIDMSMVPYNFDFAGYVVELVNEGAILMSRIDDAVSRILKVKFLLGLFETPMTFQEDYPEFASENFAADARRTALESITLLKNQGNILPLPKDAKILISGPAANNMRPLLGGWSYSWQGNLVNEFTKAYSTIYESLKDLSDNPERITLFEGVNYEDTEDFRAENVMDLKQFSVKARQADYIILCLGENTYTEFQGNDTNLELSANQQDLVKAASATGKPVILVLVQGRPRLINNIEPFTKTIVNAYLPGNYGGEALARILYGDANPSGKLPYTYPRFAYSLEPYYHKHTEDQTITEAPVESGFLPQYPFGFGLSYSNFEYSGLALDKTDYKSGENLKVSVQIQNKSGKAGMEVVQVFISDSIASNTPPVKRLRAFSKVMLQSGETQTLKFEIPVTDLAFVNHNNETLLEKGYFRLMVNKLSLSFIVNEDKIITVK